MKRILSLALITFLVLPFQPLSAATAADPDDILNIVSPKPNEKVSGNVTIEWQSFDEDQTSIPYYIQLFDGATCRTTSFGRVSSNSNAISSSSQNNKVTWSSGQTLTNPNLQDGSYCLQACFAFKNGSSYYSVCNARGISIVNVNKLPSITSVPTILTINENENWEYQLNATDPDNDTLKYYLLYAPEFLEINSSTGLVRTKPNVNRLSAGVNIAEYRVVVGVEDQISGTTSQEFTLRIERGRSPNPTTPSTPGETPDEPDTTPEAPTNSPSQISFNTPKENDEFTGLQNFIEWSIYDPEGVKEVTLSYSKDLETWTEIITRTEADFSRYSWDVSAIEDGKYFLQIKVKDNKDEVVARTSKAFFIKNTPEPDIAKNPLIINVRPENTNELTESPTSITGDFAASVDEEIDESSFAIQLNGQDITNQCNVTVNNFVCNLTTKLQEGEYSITIEVSDESGNTGNYESIFFVRALSVPEVPSTQGSDKNLGTIGIIIGVVLLILVLIIVPWLILGASKRRKVQSTKTTTTATTNLPPLPVPPVPIQPVTAQVNLPPAPQPVIQQPVTQPQPIQPVTPSADFSSFMQNYNFGMQPQPVKPQLQQEATKPRIPETQMPSEGPSQPVLPSIPQNLSQNIQMAYSGGATASTELDQTYVELPTADQAVEPQVAENNTEEELKKMYPELYGASTQAQEENSNTDTTTNLSATPNTDNGEYFEPVPKD